MKIKILALILMMLGATTSALAQMSDNGGTTAPANTNSLGQGEPFSNVTTTFDGIQLKLTRLILDPTEGTMYRMVGILENNGKSQAELQFVTPKPTLIDELGNTLGVSAISGPSNCIDNRGAWTSNFGYCDESYNINTASRMAQAVPIPFSIGFAPVEGSYNEELAALSNTVTARIHFIYTLDDFATMQTAEVIIPAIPLPK